MDSLKKLRLIQFLKKVGIHILIVLLWTSGIVLSYLIFLNGHNKDVIPEASYYMDTLNILCMLVLLFSTCTFYFLFNHTYEKNRIVKDMRSSNYISFALERLNERFVLIDVETNTYEFLYTKRENECVLKAGPYPEFISYLLDVVAKQSDKEMLAKLLPLQSLIKILASCEGYTDTPLDKYFSQVPDTSFLQPAASEKKMQDCPLCMDWKDIESLHSPSTCSSH